MVVVSAFFLVESHFPSLSKVQVELPKKTKVPCCSQQKGSTHCAQPGINSRLSAASCFVWLQSSKRGHSEVAYKDQENANSLFTCILRILKEPEAIVQFCIGWGTTKSKSRIGYVCIYLSISLSIYLSIYIYLYLSISIYIYLYLSISIYLYLSIYPSIHPSIHPSIYPLLKPKQRVITEPTIVKKEDNITTLSLDYNIKRATFPYHPYHNHMGMGQNPGT